eukprot:TRINITY_DN1119_c0_g1_i2.p1 TRINITY_DN1119_c0_g1~~TRINITY_DN1119_c0_g1_i2.p1  ORF type:complete len:459 (+),score=105.43 TRINITY_DN1119_c0_g1_i2:588-1964(+)
MQCLLGVCDIGGSIIMEDEALLEEIEFAEAIDCFSTLAESPYALVASDSRIYLANLKELTTQEVSVEKNYAKLLSLLCHPIKSSKSLFAVCSESEIDVWDLDLNTNSVKLVQSYKTSNVTAISWSKGTKKLLAGAGANPEVTIWNIEDGTHRQVKTETSIAFICWLKSASNLLAITQSNSIIIWNAKTEEKYLTITDINSPITGIDAAYDILLYSYGDTIVRFNAASKLQEAKITCVHSAKNIRIDQYDSKVYYCAEQGICEGEFQQAEEWSLNITKTFRLEAEVAGALELACSSETNSDRMVLWNEENKLILWQVEGDIELHLASNSESEENEMELLDPFFTEVSRIESELLGDVELVDIDYKARKLAVRVQLNPEVWIVLSVTVPHLYPTTIAPVVRIARSLGFSTVHKKNMTRRIKELVTRHSLKNTLSVKEAIQIVLNEIQDFSKYPCIFCIKL